MLGLQPREPDQLLSPTQQRLGLLGQGEIIGGVAVARLFALRRAGEQFSLRILAK